MTEPALDGADELPGRVFRAVMADFVTGVTVVTTRYEGIAHAMTATAFTSVSLDPPLVLVCVGHTSRFHAAVLGAGAWAVSLLAGEQAGIARHFSHRGRDLLTQFDAVPHVDAPRTGAPLIVGALNWLECRTESVYVAGDHTIVVGAVVGSAEVTSHRPPLTYYRGSYHRLGSARDQRPAQTDASGAAR